MPFLALDMLETLEKTRASVRFLFYGNQGRGELWIQNGRIIRLEGCPIASLKRFLKQPSVEVWVRPLHAVDAAKADIPIKDLIADDEEIGSEPKKAARISTAKTAPSVAKKTTEAAITNGTASTEKDSKPAPSSKVKPVAKPAVVKPGTNQVSFDEFVSASKQLDGADKNKLAKASQSIAASEFLATTKMGAITFADTEKSELPTVQDAVIDAKGPATTTPYQTVQFKRSQKDS
ncbi:MAG: hypothetical protein AAF558_14985, partial [Verrucomicrobiota bacterium]